MPHPVRSLSLIACLSGAAVMFASVPQADAQILRGHDTRAPVELTADRIEVQDRADRVVVAGHVQVFQAGLALTASRLTVAYHDTNGMEIDRLDASGGVTVSRGNERASGDVAIYDLNRRIITLIGNVRLNQGANRLSGSRLTIDLVSGRANVDGVGATKGENGNAGRVTGTFTVRQSGDEAPKE